VWKRVGADRRMDKATAARHRAPPPLLREAFRSRLGQNSFAMLTAMSTTTSVPSCSAALDALRFPRVVGH
jgi:hypothetical protein